MRLRRAEVNCSSLHQEIVFIGREKPVEEEIRGAVYVLFSYATLRCVEK